MALRINTKDVTLGFWIGAGLFLFSLIVGVFTYLANKARNVGGGRQSNG